MYFIANNLYGWARSQPLSSDEIKFSKSVCLEEVLNTPDDSDNGNFLEVELRYPYNIRQKTKNYRFRPGNHTESKEEFNEQRKTIKPKTYIPQENMICHWTK